MTFADRILHLRAWLDWHASSDLRSDRDAARALRIALDIVEMVSRCDCCDGHDAVRTEAAIAKLADFAGEQP